MRFGSNTVDLIDTLTHALTVTLLCVAIFALLTWAIPEPRNCWIPPNAPIRGIYSACWDYWEIVR